MPTHPEAPGDEGWVAILTDIPAWCAPFAAALAEQGVVCRVLDITAPSFPAPPTPPADDPLQPSGVGVVPWDPTALLRLLQPQPPGPRCRLVVNRISARPEAGPGALAVARDALACAELVGVPVVNGGRCQAVAVSKALQAAVLAACGAPAPRTVALWRRGSGTEQGEPAAAAPTSAPETSVLLKANVGGKGAGIMPVPLLGAALTDATAAASVAALGGAVGDAFGLDAAAVVQQYHQRTADGCVHRVEVLFGRAIYDVAVPIPTNPGGAAVPGNMCLGGGACTLEASPLAVGGDESSDVADGGRSAFNFCLADTCGLIPARSEEPTPGQLSVRLLHQGELGGQDAEVAAEVAAIAAASSMDLGSVEYLLLPLDDNGPSGDRSEGRAPRRVYIDINPVSTPLPPHRFHGPAVDLAALQAAAVADRFRAQP